MRILIIEDSDSIRQMIEALVSGRGHDVDAASSGAKGIEAALARRPDVILLDLNLPGALDGFEVCSRLRSEPVTSTVPILIISAMDDAQTKQRALGVGANAYFTKPFSPTALLKEVESARFKL